MIESKINTLNKFVRFFGSQWLGLLLAKENRFFLQGCFHALVFGSFLLLGSTSSAEVPRANEVYKGGTLIEYPDSGVTFILPSDVIGVASRAVPDHEMTVGVKPYEKRGDSTLYIQVGSAEFDTLSAELGRSITFNGLKLYPVGKPALLNGGIAYNDFKIMEKGEDSSGFMLVLVAKNNTAIILTAITPPNVMQTYKHAAFEIAKTVNVALSDGGSGHTQSPTGNRTNTIVGAWMTRSNRGSGGLYIESTNKWVFSADGAVAWGSGAVIAGGTAGVSLRGGGDNPPDYGRWATEGETLRINWNDGSKRQWTYSIFDYYGTPVLVLTTLDGTAYRYKKID